jgi:glyoxylate/hydroxypyruvate reductase A
MNIPPAPATVAIFSQSADLGFLRPLLAQAAPALEPVLWPDPRCREAEVAVGWDAPPGLYWQMPRLRLVHSLAAGVDNLIADQDLRGIEVCRVVDPGLAEGMVQYVLWGVLHFHRQFDRALEQQRRRQWTRPNQTPASGFRVGLLGLGELGRAAARALVGLGYAVTGWSRTARTVDGVETFSGEQGLSRVLARTDVLVCLLPLTASTRSILGEALFRQLPRGAALVHCGRGEQLVEGDLLRALEGGQLRGALLDVFEREPLDAGHPFWTAPGVIVTPHMASMADNAVVVSQVVANIGRLQRGEPLLNRVDLQLGY